MSKVNVLIVEDESIIALDIKNSLETAGYQVVAIATSSSEALDQLTRLQPDLVLMDIQLHGEMDGVTTADYIRQRFGVPVVYLTAHTDENILSRAKATQPFGYVLKPFEHRELTTTIEIALSRHKAETAIQTALLQQRELNQLRSRFVSLVSHEFRNPLNAILFSIELLQCYGPQLSEEKKETYLQRIHGSVKRMNQLLTDVLTIGETESGKLRYCPQPIDVIQFCQDLVDELQLSEKYRCPILFSAQGCWIELPKRSTRFGGSHNELSLHSTRTGVSSTMIAPCSNGDLPCLDERLLRHILTNLLSNAIKYSPSGEPIEFELTCYAETVVFRIQDRGIGIPTRDQANLFQAFHRASNVETIPGTGLGLSIVKQCVDLHEGTIDCVSEVGKGTRFTVTLPLNRQP